MREDMRTRRGLMLLPKLLRKGAADRKKILATRSGTPRLV